MNLDSVVTTRIHPAIGIARIGNSEEEYFIGPEVPNPVSAPDGGYKDAQGGLKRQAARFRIYGYDADGNVVGEITASDAEITWSVHVANKKAAWYNFDVAMDIPEAAQQHSPRRNAFVSGADRQKLVIDPGARSICGVKKQSQPFDTGHFFDQSVYLGELRTDEQGRLLFLGGRGVSAPAVANQPLNTSGNNSAWHDDTADGPVSATVRFNGRELTADPAWVVTAPPNYAPDIVVAQTMYDVIYDALALRWFSPDPHFQPSFTRDILPLFRQLADGQWVNTGFLALFGWGAPNDLLRPALLERLASPGAESQELRLRIFYQFRNPNATAREQLQWPPVYGDAFGYASTGPRMELAITSTRYAHLQQWSQGNFINDYDPNAQLPQVIEDVPLSEQPGALDHAALHFCLGGPFHAGCELSWPMRQMWLYRAPFRLRTIPPGLRPSDYGDYLTAAQLTAQDGPLSQSGPGDLTRWMGVPWQSDTASCLSGYNLDTSYPDAYLPTFWLARVPNQVLAEAEYNTVMNTSESREARLAAFQTRQQWLRGLDQKDSYIHQINKMRTHFGQLGVIEKRDGPANDPDFPPVMYVETQMTLEPKKPVAAGPLFLSRQYAEARFGARFRRQKMSRVLKTN